MYIRQHNWEPEAWDTVPLGVLIGIDPYTYSGPNDAMIKINTSMKKANVKLTIKYQVFRNKTLIKINDNCILSTQAYMIEAKRSNIIVEARRELQQTFKGTKQFAFLALKYRHLAAYANALKAETIIS